MSTNIDHAFRSDVQTDDLPRAGRRARVRAVPDELSAAHPVPATARPVSGLYVRELSGQPLVPGDELRLDVDGDLPQLAVSGRRRATLAQELHWVARLAPTSPSVWEGDIWYKDGAATLLPHTAVRIRVLQAGATTVRKAEVTFSGPGQKPFTQVYAFKSSHFDRVEFEFDATSDAHPVYRIHTGAHPNRPADLPLEDLSIATVYARTGFEAVISGGANTVPMSGAGADGVWSDTEMHDAMQANWSRFANKPQWALWVFFAAMHEDGPNLGGIMFDTNPGMQPHRQGTAIFTESFIADHPSGDPAPDAFVARTRFWTAVHEMGHAFNLAHAWQKSHPADWGTSWIPLQNEPEGRSFMNYPRRVTGGETAFYSTFRYRFSDQELLFMRHAPRRFVQMGNADWFDHHAFENAAVSPEPTLTLELRLNRPKPALEFLEPAMIELKITNVSTEPVLLDRSTLANAEQLTLIVKRDGQPARLWRPFVNRCVRAAKTALAPGESLYGPLFAGVGLDGWMIAEPGWYTLQASLHLSNDEDVVSPPLRLRVLPPRVYEEEVLGQDFFTDAVGRALAFDGTRDPALWQANDVLRTAVDRFGDRSVAAHAAVALAMPLRRAGKVLTGDGQGRSVAVVQPQPAEAGALLRSALLTNSGAAAQTLGHIEYREYAQIFARALVGWNEMEDARAVGDTLQRTLAARNVRANVIAEVNAFVSQIAGPPPAVAVGHRNGGRSRSKT